MDHTILYTHLFELLMKIHTQMPEVRPRPQISTSATLVQVYRSVFIILRITLK